MVKYFNGNNQKSSVEETMNHVNLYLEGIHRTSGRIGDDILMKRYEELCACIGCLNEEFDITQTGSEVTGRGIKRIVKKIAGKCIGWYIKDSRKRQTDFNMHVICALNSEKAILEELIRRNVEAGFEE